MLSGLCRRLGLFLLKCGGSNLPTLLDNAADVICALDANGKFISVSDSARDVFGFEPDRLIGHWLIQHIPRGDAPRVTDLMLEAKTAAASTPIESGFVRGDGLHIQILWSFKWSAAQQQFIVVAHENTAQSQMSRLLMVNEAKIRSVLESLPIGVVTCDSSGVIDSANPAAELLTGCASTMLRGRRATELFRKDRVEFEKAFVGGTTFEGRSELSSGLPCEVIVKPFEEMDGVRFCILIIDLSERVKVEQMKQEFVALVTHELRTPLTSLQALMTMLLEGVYGDLPEKAHSKLEGAEHNVVRLMGLINDILDLEKMEQGKFEFTFAQTDLTSVIAKGVAAVASFAEKQNIHISVQSSRGIVYGDAERLLQVVINLLSNAIKHSRPGDSIIVECVDGTDFVEVSVTDHGTGIPPEHHASIFERFQTVPGSRVQGTGLGLPLCKTIVARHSGQIGVDSSGTGSKFWFRIPAVKVGSPLS